MSVLQPAKKTALDAAKLVEEARNAELCRDLPLLQRILSPVWQNLEQEPLIDELLPVRQAEILRLCGFFASYYGRSHNLKDFQERGRDFLTRAIEMFDALSLPHNSAEAKVMLSLCYWHEGAILESEMILAETEAEYANNQLHPVYIQICINRVITLLHKMEGNPANAQKGLEIIEKLAVPIEFCSDLRLKSMYHNHAGLYYHHFKEPEKALYHHHEGIKTAQQAGNDRFVAVNYNNIAFLYREYKNFADAHLCVDKAIDFYEQAHETGWLAHALDTKAIIYHDEGNFSAALETIERSLEFFQRGEDYAGFADALLNKSKILLRMDRAAEAVLLFSQVVSIAQVRISEFAAQNYANEFAKLIYPLKQISYPEEVRVFKQNLLRTNLKEAELQITKTAERLGITHQNLSDILNNQYPELYDELGIKRRSRRSHSTVKTKKGKKPDNFHKRVSLVELQRADMELADELHLRKEFSYSTFVLNGSCLSGHKDNRELIVLVENSEQTPGTDVILQDSATGNFLCGRLEQDEWTKIFYFKDSENDDDRLTLLDGMKYCGKIVGFCLLDEAAESRVVFKPFP